MLQFPKTSTLTFWKCIEHHGARRGISSLSRPQLTSTSSSPELINQASAVGNQIHQRYCPGTTGLFKTLTRSISVSVPLSGKRNFRKFHLGNKRGDRNFKRKRAENPDLFPDMPIETEVKPIGYKYGDEFVRVPEMIPELIVPDLKDCNLKPYVSYRVADIVQEEFTPQELFGYVYQSKIEEDFKNGKLDENGNPIEPSYEEKLTAEEAFIQARKTGSDIFSERIPKQWECLDNFKLEEFKLDRSMYPPRKNSNIRSFRKLKKEI